MHRKPRGPLRELVRNLLASGMPPDADPTVLLRMKGLNFAGALGLVFLLGFGLTSLLKGDFPLAAADLSAFALILGNHLYLRRSWNLSLAAGIGLTVLGILFVVLFNTGGHEGTGHLWMYTYPAFSMFLLGSRRGLVATAALAGAVVVTLLVRSALGAGPEQYPPGFYGRFAASLLVVTLFAFCLERLRVETHGPLEDRVRERTRDLQRAHDRFTTVLDGIDAHVMAVDLVTDRILFLNRSARVTLGDDCVGEICWRIVHDRAELCEGCSPDALLDEAGLPGGRRTFEARSPRDGRWYYHQLRVVNWVDGRPVRLSVATDITAKRAAEEENSRLHADLIHAQRMEAMGTFAGGVAHDLNNILAGIVSYPDLLLRKLPEDSPLRRSIRTIRTSGQKCVAIVQDLLTLARRGVRKTETVDLNEIVRDYLASPEHEKIVSYHPGFEVETRLDPDLLPVKGSPVHLSKSLMNLVSNGAEAMPDGGRLTIRTARTDVGDGNRPHPGLEPGPHTCLFVADRGVGIAQEDLARIFEPFYTKKVMGRSGTGLGMAVVWGTVRDHDGIVDVESREGEGTEIRIYLPALPDPAPRDAAPAQEPLPRGRGETVLVVDDVAEQREIATGILADLGYDAVAVPSGEEAIRFVTDREVDLILLDMVMDPGIDGLETYRRILEIRPGQRAVIATGFSASASVEEAQRLGAGSRLQKPYSMHDLVVAVHDELTGGRVPV